MGPMTPAEFSKLHKDWGFHYVEAVVPLDVGLPFIFQGLFVQPMFIWIGILETEPSNHYYCVSSDDRLGGYLELCSLITAHDNGVKDEQRDPDVPGA